MEKRTMIPSLEAIAKISLEDLQTEGLGFKAKVVHWAALCLLENDLEAKIAQVSPQEALALSHFNKKVSGGGRHNVALCDCC